jgi:hypothetical protein
MFCLQLSRKDFDQTQFQRLLPEPEYLFTLSSSSQSGTGIPISCPGSGLTQTGNVISPDFWTDFTGIHISKNLFHSYRCNKYFKHTF